MLTPIIVCDNLRSCANVGTLLRTAAFFGWNDFVFVGTSPHPRLESDERLPHQWRRQTNQIAKLALGAETAVRGRYQPTAAACLKGWGGRLANLICLEQTPGARDLKDLKLEDFVVDQPIYLVLGNEIDGVSDQFLEAGQTWHIPGPRPDRSLNVAVAGAIGLWRLHGVLSG